METKELLKSRDVKPTIVRIMIYDYLITNKNHPTIDTVYKSLHPALPTLSKTSVYNTMQLFEEKRLIQTITIEDNEARYDADTTEHGHFKCIRCGEVFDFDVDLSGLKSSLPTGFEVTERHLYYRGICPSCGG